MLAGFYSLTSCHSHPSSATVFKSSCSLRQGIQPPKVVAPLSKAIQSLTETWLQGNQLPALSETAKQQLTKRINSQVVQRSDAIWQTLTQHSPEILTHPHAITLKSNIEKQLQGVEKLPWLKHVLAFEYVPSTLVMLVVTKNSYDQLQQDGKISKRENRLLMQQEYVRSVASAVIHFVRTYSSFGLVGAAMALTQHHQELRHWADKRLSHQPVIHDVAHRCANQMQQTWNTLYAGNNATFAALAMLMGLNVLSYGIMRPLILNTTFSSTLPVTSDRQNQGTQSTPRQQVTPLSWKLLLS